MGITLTNDTEGAVKVSVRGAILASPLVITYVKESPISAEFTTIVSKRELPSTILSALTTKSVATCCTETVELATCNFLESVILTVNSSASSDAPSIIVLSENEPTPPDKVISEAAV